MTVVIAGAGIGGLALGLSLHEVGIPFRIVEAVEEIKPLCVGISVQPHAVRELFEMGLERALALTGIRTRALAYFSSQGGLIWEEARGLKAGCRWPQYAMHRGALQLLLLETLRARAGDVVTTGTTLAGWSETEAGVQVQLKDRKSGAARQSIPGSVLVGCDGINSFTRARLFPDDRGAVWGGTVMWRGVTRAPNFLGGATMATIGTKAQKFVTYPIQDLGDGRALVNWIADLEKPADYPWRRQDWARRGQQDEVADAFADWRFGWLDVPKLIAEAEGIWEYPMVDLEPLPRWSFGRVTLMGDAAHATYPIGSNGASQAILDARVLAREMRRHGPGAAALTAYEVARREEVNKVVLANRGDGPDKILDTVAARAPDGFDRIEDVMAMDELIEAASRFKAVAGMDVDALNARRPLMDT